MTMVYNGTLSDLESLFLSYNSWTGTVCVVYCVLAKAVFIFWKNSEELSSKTEKLSKKSKN